MRFSALLSSLALLAACASPPPAVGTARDAVLRERGQPTARYALPEGGERLEYASGPYGRETWMIDLDAGGRVAATRQVLTESELLQVQAARDLTRDGLLRWLGTPGERRHGGWQGGEVWSWRYLTNECFWFQVSVADDGRVGSSTFGIDPLCDKGADRDP